MLEGAACGPSRRIHYGRRAAPRRAPGRQRCRWSQRSAVSRQRSTLRDSWQGGGGGAHLVRVRIGCDAFASDLNPVACLIKKVLLEEIPRQGLKPRRRSTGGDAGATMDSTEHRRGRRCHHGFDEPPAGTPVPPWIRRTTGGDAGATVGKKWKVSDGEKGEVRWTAGSTRPGETIAGSRFLSQTDFRGGVAGHGVVLERNWRDEKPVGNGLP